MLILRTLSILGLATLFCAALPYASVSIGELGMRLRAKNCESTLSEEDNGKYTAIQCVFREMNYLKIYETQTMELLAKRFYRHGGIIKLHWFENEVIYSTNDDSWIYDGTIKLPPTQLDKILSLIP